MRIGFSVFCFLALAVRFFPIPSAQAQEPSARTPEIWQKDIVILADVSGSVDEKASMQAREIIEEFVQARYDKAKWSAEGWTTQPSPYAYFQQILDGRSGAISLMTARKFLLVMQIGNLATVKSTYHARPITKFPESFTSSLRSAYPRAWRDQTTHYLLALARAYDRMKETANSEGYYLFVVSDAEDDPGREKRLYDADDRLYLESWRKESAKDEVLARWEFDVSRSSKKAMKRFSLILTAVGFNPKEKPPPLVVPEPEPEPENPLAPKIELLGGLAKTDLNRPKVFEESSPFLAWQVSNLPMEQRDFEVLVRGKDASKTRVEAPKDVADTRIKLPALVNGDYTVEIRSPREKPLVTAKAFIRVATPQDHWRWIALGSALASLGVFGYAWVTLRQAR